MFASDEFVGEGTLIDLSVLGCAIECRVAPWPDDHVRLHILMTDGQRPFRVQLQRYDGRDNNGSGSNLWLSLIFTPFSRYTMPES